MSPMRLNLQTIAVKFSPSLTEKSNSSNQFRLQKSSSAQLKSCHWYNWRKKERFSAMKANCRDLIACNRTISYCSRIANSSSRETIVRRLRHQIQPKPAISSLQIRSTINSKRNIVSQIFCGNICRRKSSKIKSLVKKRQGSNQNLSSKFSPKVPHSSIKASSRWENSVTHHVVRRWPWRSRRV